MWPLKLLGAGLHLNRIRSIHDVPKPLPKQEPRSLVWRHLIAVSPSLESPCCNDLQEMDSVKEARVRFAQLYKEVTGMDDKGQELSSRSDSSCFAPCPDHP